MDRFSFALAMAGLAGMFAMPGKAQQNLPQELQFLVQGGSYLGIGVREVDPTRVQTLKLKEERGVEVTSVEPSSPAEQAGMKIGDVVIEFAGEKVQGMDQFVRLVHETPAGRKVKIGVWRGGSAINLMATVGTRKSAIAQRMPKVEIPQTWIPDVPHPTTTWRTATLGAEAEGLEGQLAQYFGVTSGVLLRSIIEGSAAEKAGLKAGDVITKVAGDEVGNPREL